MRYVVWGIVFVLLWSSCDQKSLPKPKAMLRLDYPDPSYTSWDEGCDFRFLLSNEAGLQSRQQCDLVLEYKKMNAQIYMTYKPVKENLDLLLRDAQKLAYEHVIKADGITEQPFVNEKDQVYGMFYEIRGNAATPAQFYVTDSLSHFVTASLYFNSKPNYDSVLPAAKYIQEDMRRMMESFEWKK